MGHRFLRLQQVREFVPYATSTIYRLMDAGQFPRPHKMGERAVAWLESDIQKWIADRSQSSARQ